MVGGFTKETYTKYIKNHKEENVFEKYPHTPETPFTGYQYMTLILKAKESKSIQKALKYIKSKWAFDGPQKEIEQTIVITKNKNAYIAKIFLESYYSGEYWSQWWTPHNAFKKVAKNNPKVKVYLNITKKSENLLEKTERTSRITKKSGHILVQNTTYLRKWYESPYDINAEYKCE